MMIGTTPRITPWQKERMSPEQAEAYRKAIAPLQASLAATKAARQSAIPLLGFECALS
jgi:hypothetical protein